MGIKGGFNSDKQRKRVGSQEYSEWALKGDLIATNKIRKKACLVARV